MYAWSIEDPARCSPFTRRDLAPDPEHDQPLEKSWTEEHTYVGSLNIAVAWLDNDQGD